MSAILNNIALIDTHTHFDVDCFDVDRQQQAQLAHQHGVKHLLLIGFLAKYFLQMVNCQAQMQAFSADVPKAHLAFGLHPFYILEHQDRDLQLLEKFIQQYPSIAIGEIGLDTFTQAMKLPKNYQKQQDFFVNQLALASQYGLPVLLHIRKAHADVIQLLKSQRFLQGGIAHSFSGGIQEAKALIHLGFKIGITGQITNPNAKKLRQTVIELIQTFGFSHLVIETDCPDMTPMACHASHQRRNVPANLYHVLDELYHLSHQFAHVAIEKSQLARHLWQNSTMALKTDWQYPYE